MHEQCLLGHNKTVNKQRAREREREGGREREREILYFIACNVLTAYLLRLDISLTFWRKSEFHQCVKEMREHQIKLEESFDTDTALLVLFKLSLN